MLDIIIAYSNENKGVNKVGIRNNNIYVQMCHILLTKFKMPFEYTYIITNKILKTFFEHHKQNENKT